ncbi:MAG: hypothetical protein V4440_08625 [Pseudomonadota bacterium]
MANTIASANMSLPIPVVGVDPGPTYATDLNNCLTLIDAHTHAAGSGVPITPDGINISSDLTMGNNNLTSARSLAMTAHSAVLSTPGDLGCLSVVGVDLYYNDLSGNKIQITTGGGVAGSPGSISNLTSPASAAYVSGSSTFIWQSASNKPALMDNGSVIIRNFLTNSKGLTLAAPAAMGSDYSLILPALPASTKIMNCDASGNISASYSVDSSTIEIATNVIQVKAGGIGATQLGTGSVVTAKLDDSAVTTIKIAALNVTKAKLAALGEQLSSSCGVFTTTSTSYVDVTNLSRTLTSTGRPVWFGLMGIAGSQSLIDAGPGTTQAFIYIALLRDGSIESEQVLGQTITGSTVTTIFPVTTIFHIDTNPPSAGSHTYKIQARSLGGQAVSIQFAKLIAYEL